MTGRAEPASRSRSGRLARFGQRHRRYFAVDGGSGGHLLSALAGHDTALQPVAAPRHADLLIVVGPINPKLIPAVREMARALPRPAYALLVHTLPPTEAEAAEFLPGARHVAPDLEQILAAARASGDTPGLDNVDLPIAETPPIPLPSKRQRELATELAVLSLGPIQAFTAGPLRLLLVCDGEQIGSAQVEAGYAERGIAQMMAQADWREAADVAAHLDPLAPIAGRLAFVSAIEQLQGARLPTDMALQREAALGLERAQNHLWWLARFTRLIAHDPLAVRAYALARALASLIARLWPQPTAAWIAPQGSAPTADAHAGPELRRLTDELVTLTRRVERDRLLALRTRGIGVLPRERLQAGGVTGPVLAASGGGVSDVQARLLRRLIAAAADLRQAADTAFGQSRAQQLPRWEAPAGEACVTVDGPRGQIGLRLVSQGADRPAQVEWNRPSAALLQLVPAMLAGEKLADAEVTLASLDLAMAEADG